MIESCSGIPVTCLIVDRPGFLVTAKRSSGDRRLLRSGRRGRDGLIAQSPPLGRSVLKEPRSVSASSLLEEMTRVGRRLQAALVIYVYNTVKR